MAPATRLQWSVCRCFSKIECLANSEAGRLNVQDVDVNSVLLSLQRFGSSPQQSTPLCVYLNIPRLLFTKRNTFN